LPLRSLIDVPGRRSKMPITVVKSTGRVLPGVIYIGEPGAHLTVLASGVSDLVSHQKEVHHDPTVDLLFPFPGCPGPANHWHRPLRFVRSGSRSFPAIHHASEHTMALEPKDSRLISMPVNAIRFDGPVNVVGSIEEIA